MLTLSALRCLLAEYGPENCTLVIANAVLPLATREFPRCSLIALPTEGPSLVRDIIPAWWREREKFSREHFKQCICLSHQRTLYHETTLSWISASRDLRMLPESYPPASLDGICTDLIAHQRVVKNALGRPVGHNEILPQFSSVPSSDDHRLLVYPLSRDAERCLPVGLVIESLRLWRQRSSAPIVFGGSPGGTRMLEKFLRAARQAGIDHVTIEIPTGVNGFIEHIARAGAVLSTETAAAHVATALDKLTVVMLGGGFQGLCYPWRRSNRQTHVQHLLPCFGCGWHCTQTERLCLTQLSPAVAAAALPAL